MPVLLLHRNSLMSEASGSTSFRLYSESIVLGMISVDLLLLLLHTQH
jgi:hypothetical protein